MRSKNLLEFNDCGIYCPKGDFYIDPWKPVSRAIITHAHSDHAKYGNKYYLAHHLTAPILKYRLGPDILLETVEFGQETFMNGIKVSFHPAGHIVGSAQIRVEDNGEVWVVSGDYKTENDGISRALEVVKCHTFITESTFGLPVFKWQNQQEIYNDINNWWKTNVEKGKASILCGYALGKTQRIIKNLDPAIGPIFAHGAVQNINDVLIKAGINLPSTTLATSEISKEVYKKSIIISVPSSLNSPWVKKFGPFSSALASGWMNLRGTKRRKAVDRGFVLSDHADWNGLNEVIHATSAERVLVTHGYKSSFARWLREKGINAQEVETLYEGESLDTEDIVASVL